MHVLVLRGSLRRNTRDLDVVAIIIPNNIDIELEFFVL
jgi:hypothetical protein